MMTRPKTYWITVQAEISSPLIRELLTTPRVTHVRTPGIDGWRSEGFKKESVGARAVQVHHPPSSGEEPATDDSTEPC